MIGYATVTVTCQHCDGGIVFECEPPDYEVGVLGYSCFMLEEQPECTCTFSDSDIEALEYRASAAAWEPDEDEPV